MIWILLISLVILFAISTPIAIALGSATALAVIWTGEMPVLAIVQRMFNSVDMFPLMAIPFFILAGSLMETGGISKRLINFASALVGEMKGGLAAVAVVTSMFFAAISGSSPATVAAIGSILIPAMVARGYHRDFAAAVQATSGGLGVIIPPSIPIILYGVTAEVSVGDLFIAGIVPGLLVSLSLLILVYFLSRKKGYQGTESSTTKQKLVAFREALLALLMPVIILGGIYGGIFTPTEAAVVAVVYAFVVGKFVYREITWKSVMGIFSQSAVTTSIIMIIIANAGVFGWLLTRERVPQMVAESFLNYTESPIIFLLLINLLLLFVGMIFETSAAIIILAPILAPIAVMVGIDPVHFGIIMVVNLAIGMVTPPVGVNLFVAAPIAGTSLEKISRAVLPFIALLIINVLMISFIPKISTILLDVFK
ncbi:TRAP transporter large permease [Alkalihalobacillus oceani]|uniref:TRAP transporter large permease n=1 Tax=Halalkalibacter oceani TaxID=1653776 RepID=A0A9X2DQA9_9BACI|nr:TRAP transporter large permease [Halalkalibacter oceani]MCM3714513.1 TRAP transporter large permease [Halalkalibacter oceani]